MFDESVGNIKSMEAGIGDASRLCTSLYVMKTKGNKKLRDWLLRCDAIAECDSFLRSRHPEDQVIFIRAALLRAAAEGVNWRTIYRSIYKEWHTRRPHFPDFNTMAAEIDRYR